METDSIATLRDKLAQSETNNEAIIRERDKYRKEAGSFRIEVSTLQSRVEELDSENKDLLRKLSMIEVTSSHGLMLFFLINSCYSEGFSANLEESRTS